jgi:hypothetical protein
MLVIMELWVLVFLYSHQSKRKEKCEDFFFVSLHKWLKRVCIVSDV